MKTIVCRVDNGGVRFSRESYVGWAMTNLPKVAFTFSSRRPIYWEVEMQSFDANTLFVRVKNFEADALEYNPERIAKRAINKLCFSVLPRDPFIGQLSIYKLATLTKFIGPARQPEGTAEPAPPPFEVLDGGQSPDDASTQVLREVRFTTPLASLTISDGFLRGLHDMGALGVITYRIQNRYLMAGFDAIKPFFAAKLSRKSIQVTLSLTTAVLDGTTEAVATSPQIKRINGSMIELLRTRTLRQLLKGEGLGSLDQSLFTQDDIVRTLPERGLGKALLPQDGRALLDAIIDATDVRNARELSYLAGVLQDSGEKLRFVLRPKFGFLFTVQGESATHLILELLNDHATYVWSIPHGWGTAAEEYKSVALELARLGELGRQRYRSLGSYAHPFWIVVHGGRSGLVDGFGEWCYRLGEGLG